MAKDQPRIRTSPDYSYEQVISLEGLALLFFSIFFHEIRSMFESHLLQNEWELLLQMFPALTSAQKELLHELWNLYSFWNARVNLISRKDIEHLYKHHVLHSLSIAWKTSFVPGMKVLDVGTGGGFPGIPLAILFPYSNFYLVDSIAKKIKVVEDIIKRLQLSNVEAICSRVEHLDLRVNLVVARAVAKISDLTTWTNHLIMKSVKFHPSYALLKGEDVVQELNHASYRYHLYYLKDFITDAFFESKVLVHIF